MDNVILVTGGAGAIGSNLTNYLLRHKRKVVVIDDLSSGYVDNLAKSKDLLFITGDICRDSVLKKAFSCGISVVFHLAANFANQNSIDHPKRDLETNVLGTMKLLKFSVKKGVKKFVYGSTSCVYGGMKGAIKEDALDFKHDTPYSISKLTGEKYVTFFGDYYGLAVCVLRYFNVYGPGEMPGRYRNVIPNFFYKAIGGSPLMITGTGDETRDFTYVDDVVRTTVNASCADRANGKVFNVASGVETRIIDLAAKINKIAGNEAGIVFAKRRDWDRISRRCASIKKAEKILNHKVTTGLDEGLEKTYRWLKAKIGGRPPRRHPCYL